MFVKMGALMAAPSAALQARGAGMEKDAGSTPPMVVSSIA
jgi:hypothetical protein